MWRGSRVESIRCSQCVVVLFRSGPEALPGSLKLKCRLYCTIDHLRAASSPPERQPMLEKLDVPHGKDAHLGTFQTTRFSRGSVHDSGVRFRSLGRDWSRRRTWKAGGACVTATRSRGWRHRRRLPPCGVRSASILWAIGPTTRGNSSCSPRMRTRSMPGLTTTPGRFWRRTLLRRDVVAQPRVVGAPMPRSRPWLQPLSWGSDSSPTLRPRRGGASPSPRNPVARSTT